MCSFINADDFGRNEKANKRIIDCLKSNYVTSTTIMMNTKYSEQAIEEYKKIQLKQQIGIHFVLDEGRPLSKEMQHCRKFCNERGDYKANIPRHQYLNKKERYAVYSECIAQIDRAKALNVEPTYLDSHRHRHMDIFIALAIRRALIDRGITIVRNGKDKIRGLKNIYYNIVRKIYVYKGYISLNPPVISIYDIENVRTNSIERYEIMCHPEMDRDYELLIDLFNKKQEGK